jgi:hypothetical protein
MSKQTVVAVVAMVARCLASADASADPTCPAAPLSDATTLHKLHVEVQAADGSGPMLAASTGSVFPAESVDGKAIVMLFADTHDLSGSRISTVVFWSSTGKRLDALRIDADDACASDCTGAIAATINARLAKTTWRTLASADGCPSDGDRANVTIMAFTGGPTLRFTIDADGNNLVVETAAKKQRRVRVQQPGAGTHDTADGGQFTGTCGVTNGVLSGFWSKRNNLLVVVPRGYLGGDWCQGRPTADLAIALRLP